LVSKRTVSISEAKHSPVPYKAHRELNEKAGIMNLKTRLPGMQ
jgi:hypothetical protein